MWMYRSKEIAKRLRMLAVHDITSAEIHSLQKSFPNHQDPVKSFTIAKGMTKDATSKSDKAKEKKNRFESLRSRVSVRIATQTSKLPKMAKVIKTDIMLPIKTFSNIWTSVISLDVFILA